MIVFDKAGKQHTQQTLQIAAQRAKQDGVHLVVASSKGDTALAAIQAAKEQGILHQLVIVGCVVDKGVQRMTQGAQDALRQNGVPLVITTHVLSGAERGLSTKMGGVYPVEIMAYTLRMFGQGVKVCVECAIMALDCAAIPYGEAVVAVGGTGGGADCACILTPSGGNTVLDCKVHEILCKPY